MAEHSEIEDAEIKALKEKIGDGKFHNVTQQTTFINNQFKKRRKKAE